MDYYKKISPNTKKIIIFISLFLLLAVSAIIFTIFNNSAENLEKLNKSKRIERLRIERFLVAEKRASEGVMFHTLLDYARKKEKDRVLAYERKIKNSKGRVYLTFDDGPSIHTEPILDILKKYNVKATFFVVGKKDKYSIKRYKRIVKEGHTIALHSYSHKFEELYSSLEAFKKDYYAISNLVYKVTGIRSKFYRFPGGSSTSHSKTDMKKLIKFLDNEGVTFFDWNAMSGDAVRVPPSANELCKNVMSEVLPGRESIVLMHDLPEKKTTVEALPQIIEKLQKEGYILLPIDENTVPIHHHLYRD